MLNVDKFAAPVTLHPETDTCATVSKTIDKRECEAPYLRTVFLLCVCVYGRTCYIIVLGKKWRIKRSGDIKGCVCCLNSAV